MLRSLTISFTKICILFGCINFVSGATLLCFKGSLNNYIDVPLTDNADPKTILNSSCYSPGKNTVIYVHGYLQKITDNSGSMVLQSYLDGHNTNVIGLDWFEEVSYPVVGVAALPKAFVNSIVIGRKLGKFVVKMIYAGLPLARLHLIGFSLGNNVMGEVGRYVRNNINQLVPRITGLDPPKPFTDRPLALVESLNTQSAQLVYVYHSNPGGAATVQSLGTVDIWVNCGSSVQPGCENAKLTNIQLIFTPQDICSHLLATKFFADAVRRSSYFKATAAPCCEAWSKGEGTKKTIYLGDNIDKTAVGNYYIKINTNTSEYQTAAAAKENCVAQQRVLNLKALFPIKKI